MSPRYQSCVALAARLLLCVIFLLSGINKVTHWSENESYMREHGMTTATSVLLAGAAFVEIAGGLALLLGFRVRLMAVVLFLFLIPTTLIFHNFWALEGAARQMQMINFLKNLAIMGGLLDLSIAGAGALSIDAAIVRSQTPAWAFWRRRAV